MSSPYPENPPSVKWRLIEGDEGKPVTLECTSSSQTANSFQSANVQWFKVKELENVFQRQKLSPVERIQSSVKEEEIKKEKDTPARQVYWESDLKAPDWSIKIDSLEMDDASLYQCDIKTESGEEMLLMELVVNRK